MHFICCKISDYYRLSGQICICSKCSDYYILVLRSVICFVDWVHYLFQICNLFCWLYALINRHFSKWIRVQVLLLYVHEIVILSGAHGAILSLGWSAFKVRPDFVQCIFLCIVLIILFYFEYVSYSYFRIYFFTQVLFSYGFLTIIILQ